MINRILKIIFYSITLLLLFPAVFVITITTACAVIKYIFTGNADFEIIFLPMTWVFELQKYILKKLD